MFVAQSVYVRNLFGALSFAPRSRLFWLRSRLADLLYGAIRKPGLGESARLGILLLAEQRCGAGLDRVDRPARDRAPAHATRSVDAVTRPTGGSMDAAALPA